MNNSDKESVWNILLNANLVQGEKPVPDTLESPWYIQLLLAISGWLSSLFLLGFIGAAGLILAFDNLAVALIVGTALISGAYAILRIPKNTFFEHLALAISLAGQCLIIWGIVNNTKSDNGWPFVFLLQLILMFIIPSFTHRVLLSLATAVSFSVVMATLGLPYVSNSILMAIAAWLWLHEFRYPKYMKQRQAIAYGFTLALIMLKSNLLFSGSIISWYVGKSELNIEILLWLEGISLVAILLYVVHHFLKQFGHTLLSPMSIATLLVILLIGVVSFHMQGIIVGTLILLLGFASSNRVLMGLGITSLLFYISYYYYLLDFTLMEKCSSLLIMGIILFVIKYIAQRLGKVAHD